MSHDLCGSTHCPVCEERARLRAGTQAAAFRRQMERQVARWDGDLRDLRDTCAVFLGEGHDPKKFPASLVLNLIRRLEAQTDMPCARAHREADEWQAAAMRNGQRVQDLEALLRMVQRDTRVPAPLRALAGSATGGGPVVLPEEADS